MADQDPTVLARCYGDTHGTSFGLDLGASTRSALSTTIRGRLAVNGRRGQSQRLLLNLTPGAERLAMVVGFGAVGVSAFAMMAAGPRVLGTSGYTSLALVWTAVTIIGIGVASPGEQVITRSVAAGTGGGVARVVGRRLAVATPLCLALVPFLGGDSDGGADAWIWGLTLLLSAVSWMVLGVQRGKLAGQGLFAAYAATLVVEAVVRIAVVALAWLLPASGLLLLASATSVPLAMSAALALWWTRQRPLASDTSIPDDTRLEHISMTAMALMLQVCLNTGQLWLNRQSSDPALAGAFVTAASYMRVPTIFAAGLYAPLLTGASTAFAQGRKSAVLRKTLEAMALGAGGSAMVVAVLLAVRPLAMTILYGNATGLDPATYLWLGLATIAIVAASVTTNALYGCDRAGLAALAWIPPAAVTTAIFSAASGDPTAMAIATTAGQALALALLFGLLLHALGVVRLGNR